MKDADKVIVLRLTREEALGLLDILVLSKIDFSAEQRAAAEKLGDYCRELLRDTLDKEAIVSHLKFPDSAALVD